MFWSKKDIKYITLTAISVVILILLAGCNKTIYIPVKSIRTEYSDCLQRDSVLLYDSVFVKIADDTVWLEKYKYIYRDKLRRDSVFITDSIQVPYPVIKYKEVNKLKNWQHFMVWTFGISIFIVFIISSITIFKRKF